jgi:polar amino acid transport system substrate-binding protein
MRRSFTLSLGLATLVLVAACSASGGASPSASTAASAAASVAPSAAASTAPSAAASASAAASGALTGCAKADLTLVTPGKFTIGTDNPAYPPYFATPAASAKPTAPWQLGDPTNGNGFEAAVGYAIADKLGFTKDEVAWIVVPFNNSFAPGPKTFDIDLNQVNFKPARTQTADLSKGYYFGNQSVVVLKGSKYATATSVADLKDAQWGAQVGTTSLDAINTVIAPTKKPVIYDTNDLAVEALGKKTIDAIMVDLPTADYITNVQVQNAVIAGQFQGGTPEYFSAVLQKGSKLTGCINQAIDALTADGTLDKLVKDWLPFQASVPVIKP